MLYCHVDCWQGTNSMTCGIKLNICNCEDICSHDDVIKWKHISCYWPFVRETTAHQWIPLTKVSDAELWCFLWFAPGQTGEQTIETPVICDAIALLMTSLQCSCRTIMELFLFIKAVIEIRYLYIRYYILLVMRRSNRNVNILSQYIDGLVQDCSNSIANALELLQSCTKPSIYAKCNPGISGIHGHHGKARALMFMAHIQCHINDPWCNK